jgi:hypothetical protein
MRKLTREIVSAFLNGNKKTKGNTSTDGQSIWLHGNQIVETNQDGKIVINNCGWGTVTTRERLNGLLNEIAPHLGVVQRNFDQYIQDSNNDYALTPFEGDYIVGSK